eukprot:12190729-Alexandrium_andersonii.AAC.1
MSDGLCEYECRLAHLLCRSYVLASGPSSPVELYVAALLPEPKSANSAKHLARLAHAAARAQS